MTWVYGGHLVAQALEAACGTVDARLHPHVLHASYIRAARPGEHIFFAVERVRDGRRFATRRVDASQDATTVMTMTAGFHAREPEGTGGALAAPHVPAPEQLAPGGWNDAIDCRYVSREEPGHVTAWMRLADPAVPAPMDAACALAYLADDLPGDAVLELVGGTAGGWCNQSLDHSVWLHRVPRPGGWQLHDLRCQGVVDGRGLVLGNVFDGDGVHLATVAQEVLVRRGRAGAPGTPAGAAASAR